MILKSKKEVTWVPCICLLSYMEKDELASQYGNTGCGVFKWGVKN